MFADNINLADAKVLVIGDVMLDRYWSGDTSRVSPEAPVPVVRVKDIEDRAGGAANVAINICALGGQAALVGVVGADTEATRLQGLLTQRGVEVAFASSPLAATITKLRIMSRHQQLIRLDFEGEPCLDSKRVLLDHFKARVAASTIVVLSDYAKGAVSEAAEMIAIARAHGVPVLVDPKGHDFERYRGATLLTPNLSEFELVVGKCRDEADLVEKAHKLREQLDLEALLVTRGDQGMTLVQSGVPVLHIPTEAVEVYDVTGAGDTVISALAVCMGAKVCLAEAARFSNMCAGIAVGKAGTATVTMDEVRARYSYDNRDGVLPHAEALVEVVAKAKKAGKRIVMTNGCFDILHTGHVRYLKKARELGDLLVVAVNTDRSVKELKGDSRPLNSLESRCEILAALGCVDYVVPFDESTPESLICKVGPDFLVKGGDYKVENIAGSDFVLAAGGQVVLIDYVDGFSTTALITKIENS